MTQVPDITPPDGNRSRLTIQDVARALQEGGINRLAVDGRAMVIRGRAGIMVASLESANTIFLIRIEVV